MPNQVQINSLGPVQCRCPGERLASLHTADFYLCPVTVDLDNISDPVHNRRLYVGMMPLKYNAMSAGLSESQI